MGKESKKECVYVSVLMNMCVCAKSLYSCLTLGNCMDYSLPGSSVHVILQARMPTVGKAISWG